MRIITGKRRGLRLDAPAGEATRPTADRVKEALFSMLSSKVDGADVLDLFAGSGALGLECLSRGARACDFVENSPEAAAVVRRNMEKARFRDEGTLHPKDFRQFLMSTGKSYDLIFLDPPYRSGYYGEALRLICERKLLRPDGWIVLEWDGQKPETEPFDEVKERQYGRVHISILESR